MSKWKVLFEENFWGSQYMDDESVESAGQEPEEKGQTDIQSIEAVACESEPPMPTEEHRINQMVTWYGETWKVLSLYTCPKGLVLDYCKKIDPEKLEAFTSRFRSANFSGEDFDEEQFERIQLENPTAPHVHVRLMKNGKDLSSRGNSSLTYVPGGAEIQENDPLAPLCMAHYGLDTRYAWMFSRAHYFWNEEGLPEQPESEGNVGCTDRGGYDLSGLTAVFDEMEITVPGERFHLTGETQKIPLTHAVSGEHFDLCIESVEAGELEQEVLSRMGQDVEMVYPTYYESVSYYTKPEFPAGSYFLKSRVQGDSPIVKDDGEKAASVVFVVGGSSGPTSVFLAGKQPESGIRTRSVCSPLFFKPTPVRDWYICYLYKRREPLSVPLSV